MHCNLENYGIVAPRYPREETQVHEGLWAHTGQTVCFFAIFETIWEMMLLWVAQSSFPSCLASSSRRLHRLHADGVAICALAGMGLRHTKFAQTRSLGEGSKNIIVSRHRVGPDSCSNSVLVSRWSMLSHVNGHLLVQQKAVGTFIQYIYIIIYVYIRSSIVMGLDIAG